MLLNRFALVSLYNKTNLDILGKNLLNKDYNILSTGGTYNKLNELFPLYKDRIIKVENFSGFPEILGGRVKTLNPIIMGGILSRNTKDDLNDLEKVKSTPIDIVAVNLYPFSDTIKNNLKINQEVIEQIDIGGVTLIRAACKNYNNVTVLTDPKDYKLLENNISDTDRFNLATKGFHHVAEYDMCISEYFSNQEGQTPTKYRSYSQEKKLKYGCNPNQDDSSIWKIEYPIKNDSGLKVLNGKIGYINTLDAVSSWNLVCELKEVLGYPATASFKHLAPAGVGLGINTISTEQSIIWNVPGKKSIENPVSISYVRARQADPLSSFGDMVAISDIVDEETANLIKPEVSDGIIAKGYTEQALEILKKKKNGNYLIIEGNTRISNLTEMREYFGVCLSQKQNNYVIDKEDFNCVTKENNSNLWIDDLILANITLKYTPSNSIVYAYEGQVIGVGAGQQNRVDCVRLAGEKATMWWNRLTIDLDKDWKFSNITNAKRQERVNMCVELARMNIKPMEKQLFSLASDAFFPFSDNIETAKKYGVKAIVQPGGSIADNEVIDCCNKNEIAMYFTGNRLFLH